MKAAYLKMLEGMVSEGRKEWSLYVLRCGDGSLYTGITKDIESRLKQHQKGKGAAYTRTHLPVQLVYSESEFTRSEALIREAKIKRMPRPKKEALISASARTLPSNQTY